MTKFFKSPWLPRAGFACAALLVAGIAAAPRPAEAGWYYHPGWRAGYWHGGWGYYHPYWGVHYWGPRYYAPAYVYPPAAYVPAPSVSVWIR